MLQRGGGNQREPTEGTPRSEEYGVLHERTDAPEGTATCGGPMPEHSKE